MARRIVSHTTKYKRERYKDRKRRVKVTAPQFHADLFSVFHCKINTPPSLLILFFQLLLVFLLFFRGCDGVKAEKEERCYGAMDFRAYAHRLAFTMPTNMLQICTDEYRHNEMALHLTHVLDETE